MDYSIIFEAKKRCNPTIREFLDLAQKIDWAKKEHYTLWFRGELVRDGRTERVLKRLTDSGRLRSIWYGRYRIYCAKRKNKKKTDHTLYHIEHGLGCTEGLVRFWRSDMSGEVIPEKDFKFQACVPEWGIRYPSGTLLLYEFCTEDNFNQRLKSKVWKYQYQLLNSAEKTVVLFVLDVDAVKVQKFVARHQPVGQFFFTDYQTFLKVPFGKQFSAPIYIWGEDQKTYPLMEPCLTGT